MVQARDCFQPPPYLLTSCEVPTLIFRLEPGVAGRACIVIAHISQSWDMWAQKKRPRPGTTLSDRPHPAGVPTLGTTSLEVSCPVIAYPVTPETWTNG